MENENKKVVSDNLDSEGDYKIKQVVDTSTERGENQDNAITAPKRGRGAKKGELTEKTNDALAKGREKLKQKWEEDRKRKEELNNKYAIKKANKLIKEKLNIKKNMGIDENDTEEEEPVKVIQPKKPKKKQVIVLQPESESEEEIVVKKSVKTKKQPTQQQPVYEEPTQNKFKLVFF